MGYTQVSFPIDRIRYCQVITFDANTMTDSMCERMVISCCFDDLTRSNVDTSCSCVCVKLFE